MYVRCDAPPPPLGTFTHFYIIYALHSIGMDYFLPKPFSLQKFIETIRSSRLSRMQAEQAAKSSAAARDTGKEVVAINGDAQDMSGSNTHITTSTVTVNNSNINIQIPPHSNQQTC
ncbi:hypothetical protein EON64_15815 [archaeon]|nr:MAG: hypothetical protein EON64_15815 [archaeon]